MSRWLAVIAVAWGASPLFSNPPDFQRDVAPLLIKNCLECHKATDPSGGLDLTSSQTLQRGGDSGAAIDTKQLDASLLWQRVQAGEMPPEKNGQAQPLPEAEQQVLRAWVEAGAPWPEGRVLDAYERTTAKRAGRDWWAFQPLSQAEPPAIDGSPSQCSPIDAFWLAGLKSQGFEPAPPAARATWLRRVYYDLIGLPPTAEEIEAFAADNAADAYANVVDRLLDQPQFGERWARYWLDLVRYAETNGYERDAVKPHAWRYRDWVIAAFNSDMPYDRFVTEQLAGDELAERTEQSVIATGFLRLGTWDDEPNDPLEYQYDRLEDMVHATTTAFLGLTVKCARCHDHKFDPIPQSDYYRIAAAFWAGPVAHRQREWNGGPTKEELGFDVLGWTDLGRDAPELHLLKKGNVHRPGEVVAAGTLTATPSMTRQFQPSPAEAKTTQRRLQLAQWIVDRQNPLTARVMVNRIWQHLFGEGLVRSPDNFGFQGQKPVQPELLDWLARDFLQGDWHIKRMIRQIVLTQAYQQSSVHPRAAEFEQRDPENLYGWRANRRRLDAEALRDSILQVSGRLDLRTGGESFRAPINQEALEGLSMKSGAYQASPESETTRRSIYMFAKRSLQVPLMTVFDCCDSTTPSGRRDVTIVAPQALTLLNNEAIMSESQKTAERVLASADDTDGRAQAAWRIVLGRLPGSHELELARQHVAKVADPTQAWTAICHVLVNTNEFIYVD